MEPDHKELLIGLLGSTYGELKKLDDSIIGSSSTLARRSNNVKEEITKVIKGVPPPPDVPILQAIAQPQPQQQFIPQPAPQPDFQFVAPQIQQPISDPNQLELDLNKSAKYDDIQNYLYTITDRLNRIEDKIDQLIKSNNVPKKKVQPLNSGLVQS